MTLKQKLQDGGYYAIKGFAYQIDKAILELLNASNEDDPINIEQIQDIDSDSFVIQVKYRETKKFTPNVIKEPVIQLIKDFNVDPTKIYILYAYFKDLNKNENFVDKNNMITMENLNNVLGNRKNDFSHKEKSAFVKKFQLVFSSEFQCQFQQVIHQLKCLEFIGNSDEEAIFYYSNICEYFTKLVVNNSPGEKERRTCTRRAIIDILKNGQKLIFNTSLRMYQGERKYFKLVKEKNFKFRNIDNFARIFIIHLKGNESPSEIKNEILAIRNKFYKKQRDVLKSRAPYIYIHNCKTEELSKLKWSLVRDNIIIKDGYDFKDARFDVESLISASTIDDNVSVKFINNEEKLLAVLQDDDHKAPVKLYQFYFSTHIEVTEDIKHVNININNIADISQILA